MCSTAPSSAPGVLPSAYFVDDSKCGQKDPVTDVYVYLQVKHAPMSRVSDQKGVSLLCIMLEIHHSDWEPSNFLCVCMHVAHWLAQECTGICTCLSTHAHIKHMHACEHTHTGMHTHTYTYACMHSHTRRHAHVCAHACTYMHTCAQMCVCAHGTRHVAREKHLMCSTCFAHICSLATSRCLLETVNGVVKKLKILNCAFQWDYCDFII